MKASREFAVLLGTGSIDGLDRARKLSGGSRLAFPPRSSGPLPPKAPIRVLRSAGISSTLHGSRSSARSWMAESGVPAEVAEA